MATGGTIHQGVFETALKNARQPSGPFPFTLSDDIGLSEMSEFEDQIKTRIRQQMDEELTLGSSWFLLHDLASEARREARDLLDRGDVAAVDGTNAMAPTNFMATGAYVVAAGFLTSQQRAVPHVRLTCTSTRYKDPTALTDDELLDLCEELTHGRQEDSWPATFREYQERELSLSCGTSVVLIDGPIFTQNLLTQPSGRELYDRMLMHPSRYLGIIKNLGSTDPLQKMFAYALHPGEGYMFPPVKESFRERFSKVHHVQQWTNALSEDFVRAVFRPKQKAFGVECRIQDLPLAMAIMLENASQTLNHELPILMELIDSQLRSSYQGGQAAATQLIAKIQRLNYRMGVDVRDERDYR